MTLTPTQSPERLLPTLAELTQEQALDQVDRMTDADLDRLKQEIDQSNDVPEVFKNEEMLAYIEARINHTSEAQSKLDALRAKFEASRANIEEQAEKSFLAELQEKGGGWAVIASMGISILSFFGFKKAKELKKSLKEKGYLKTAIEGAKEHPIFAAFISALGLKAGSEAYAYVSDNKDVIEQRITEIAGEKGASTMDVIDQFAEDAKDVVAQGADKGLRGTVKGLAWLLGGTYNEETGVVELPHSSLRPPVIVAYQAGVRRRGGTALTRGLMNRFVVEDRLNTILRQTDVVATNTKVGAIHKKKLAERALELMNKNVIAGSGTKEGLELERIFEGLSDDLKLSQKDMIEEVRLKPQDAEKRVKILQDEMTRLKDAEMGDFKAMRDSINNTLADAEKRLANGDFKGSAENFKQKALKDIQVEAGAQQKNLLDQKLPISKQLTDALNHLSDQEALKHRTANQLNTSTAGNGLIEKTLEATTRKAEAAGYNIKKLPGGKWVTRGIIGYSLLPLAMEAGAALRPGEEGEQAKKALTLDATEAGLGFIPGVGEVMDFRTAFMGTDLNGREIDTTGRITAGVMGTLGIASIGLGFVTGGTSIIGFRALRGAVSSFKAARLVRKAQKGVEVAGVTSKSLKYLNKAKKQEDKLEKMLKLSKLQKKATKARSIVQNAQRGMQIYTYGHLGVQVASGAIELYNSTENIGETLQQKAVQGIDAAQQFARSNLA